MLELLTRANSAVMLAPIGPRFIHMSGAICGGRSSCLIKRSVTTAYRIRYRKKPAPHPR